MTDLPAAAIEAAAEAIIVPVDDPETDYRDIARAAIEAAMPAIREALAREVNRAKPNHITRDYTAVDQAWDQAANVVRGAQ